MTMHSDYRIEWLNDKFRENCLENEELQEICGKLNWYFIMSWLLDGFHRFLTQNVRILNELNIIVYNESLANQWIYIYIYIWSEMLQWDEAHTFDIKILVGIDTTPVATHVDRIGSERSEYKSLIVIKLNSPWLLSPCFVCVWWWLMNSETKSLISHIDTNRPEKQTSEQKAIVYRMHSTMWMIYVITAAGVGGLTCS